MPTPDPFPSKQFLNLAMTLGHVHTWGRGWTGALGHGDNDDSTEPRRVLGQLEDKWVVSVSCGADHTLACEHIRGTAYSWGDGGRGRLGLLDEKKRNQPCKLQIGVAVVGISSPMPGLLSPKSPSSTTRTSSLLSPNLLTETQSPGFFLILTLPLLLPPLPLTLIMFLMIFILPIL